MTRLSIWRRAGCPVRRRGGKRMGGYHGKASFDLFSHRRSIVKKYNWIDLPIRYQPYTSWKRTLLELFLR